MQKSTPFLPTANIVTHTTSWYHPSGPQAPSSSLWIEVVVHMHSDWAFASVYALSSTLHVFHMVPHHSAPPLHHDYVRVAVAAHHHPNQTHPTMTTKNSRQKILQTVVVYDKCNRLKVRLLLRRGFGGVPFELFLPMFSLSMTSSSHVTLRSSGLETAWRWSITDGSCSCCLGILLVMVWDPVVGVSSRSRTRCMIVNCPRNFKNSRRF
jgi:hypothetical protein